MTATIGSLFSGVGGLELGIETALPGASVIWQAENDPAARRVLAAHWPAVHRYTDVRQIDDQAPRPDIICGGSPCQDISAAGKGAGIEGERSSLWFEFARIIRALRPGVVFFENVPPIVKRGLDRILGDLAEVGMSAVWDCFRAADVGAPHRRERFFLLAYADSGRREGERLAQPGRVEGAPGREPDGRGHDRYVHRFPPGPTGIADWDGPLPAVRRGDARTPVGMDRGWRAANRIADRLRLLGNACVPQQAALAWSVLVARAAGLEERAA